MKNKADKYDADLAHWYAEEEYLNKGNRDKISTYWLLTLYLYKSLLSN